MGKFCPPSHTGDTWELRHFSGADRELEQPTQLSPHHMNYQMTLFIAVIQKLQMLR